ncbi:Set domain group [Thalictrum thalictroides]|uniref:Set domain group n=1 Tax=Thalictrum thalictroides TaxID=46969 RepID=A0A7J6WLS1_THATH|nr:Set domain group [Thalictrum thalictroides]
MEMRSLEKIEGIGVDLTPKLQPIAFSLCDPFLHSHCYSCYRTLPSIHTDTGPIRYCSLFCSRIDYPIHFNSGEHHLFLILQSHSTTWHTDDTSDLRTALRLLHHFNQLGIVPSLQSDRIGGLLTNREKLKQQEDDDILARIKEGGRLMSLARIMRDDEREVEENNTELEEMEMVLCIVLTNAVEVQVNEKQGLGVAVYGPSFSWINHSCAPNACYRFSIAGPESDDSGRGEPKMRITTFGDEPGEIANENALCGYGPRIVVRSIKPMKKGEEVCVAYTDLLQPKAMRHTELWLRYRFICSCRRCSALSPTHVDHILHGNYAANPESTNSRWEPNFYKDNGYEELSDCMDEIISEYMSTGNPECCCDKLEIMLRQSLRKEQLQSWPTFKLHPLHHLCLNAYITLASVYKIRASELLSSDSVKNKHRSKFSKLSRFSAAYSLLLAGATHHLFLSESSLIVSAVHFWISAGESLLSLSKSLIWTSVFGQKCPNSSIFSHPGHSHCECLLMERFEVSMPCDLSQSASTKIEFEEISKGFMNCASRLSSEVWPFLTEGGPFFEDIQDPINFSWLETIKYSHALLLRSPCTSSHRENDSYCGLRCEREHLFQLGVHCLVYGEYLATICYSSPCYLTNHVRSLLQVQNKEIPFEYTAAM